MAGIFRKIDSIIERLEKLHSELPKVSKLVDQNELLIDMLREELKLARQEKKELERFLYQSVGIIRVDPNAPGKIMQAPIRSGIDWRAEKERLEAEKRALYWETKKKEDSEKSRTTSQENTSQETATGTSDSQPTKESKV